MRSEGPSRQLGKPTITVCRLLFLQQLQLKYLVRIGHTDQPLDNTVDDILSVGRENTDMITGLVVHLYAEKKRILFHVKRVAGNS